jgi:hypothetical protein
MPRVIHCPTEETLELGDLVEMLETGTFDPRDEECLASWGPALKKLGNNRDFLAEIVIRELKDRCEGQVRENQYGSQVILLHGRSQKFMIRANVWPAAGDSIFKNSGSDPFFYGLPHDHNFSFLTVGYLGPGYWSDYYEYDYGSVVGFTGEKVDLRFIEKARLEQGKVMLYRSHKDVHLQLPADAMSVSLNIMEISHAQDFRDQYRFDVERSEIAGILTRTSLEPLLALSAHYGGDNGLDLLDTFAASHPSDRIRFRALQARASAAADLDARIALFAKAANGGSRFVSAMARREAERLEKGRPWIEGTLQQSRLQALG